MPVVDTRHDPALQKRGVNGLSGRSFQRHVRQDEQVGTRCRRRVDQRAGGGDRVAVEQ